MKCYASASLGVILTLGILDYIWLGLVQKDNWKNQITAIQGSVPEYKKTGMIIAYAIMIIVKAKTHCF